MSVSSRSTIDTAKASGYLQQLCKHFSHKTDATFTAEAGSIVFEFGRGDLSALHGKLMIRATAETDTDLARLKRVLASHLERFAFREDLTINWDT